MSLRVALPLSLLFALCFGGCSSDGTTPLTDGGILPCTTNDQCRADQHCVAGACVLGSGNECEGDDGCAPNEMCEVVTGCGAARCSGNTCVPRPCTEHEDCPDGVCLQGACAEPPACDDETRCPGDLVCVEGECAPFGPCTDDDECDEGFICSEGECVEELTCTGPADCPPDLMCIGGVCRPGCTQDSDCGPAALWTCDSGECRSRCFNNGQCPAGQFCEQFVCRDAECQADEDCNLKASEACIDADSGRGHCEVVMACQNGMCPTGFACNAQTNRCEPLPGCRTDRDCGGNAYCDQGFCIPADSCSAMSCPDGFDCVRDVCVPHTCRGPSDCPTPGEICVGGECRTPPPTTFVTQVRIITPAGRVRPGTSYRFVAVALDQADRVVPGVRFAWTTTSTSIATIDADGLATGQQLAGTTDVRATVQSGAGPVTSPPVQLENLGPLAAEDIRISVVRLTNGLGIPGARVELLTEAGITTTQSDARGVATFVGSRTQATFTVTVTHDDFDWVTAVDASVFDLSIPLPPPTRPGLAAGAKGSVDLSNVSTQGAISLSLSGASMPSPLLSFDGARLFGGEQFQVAVPMVGNIPIPGGNTVAVQVMGFPLNLKDTFYAEADPGLRAIWSFGGRIALGTNGLGLGDLQNIATAILPFYQRFDHAVRPAVQLVALPTVVDTRDIDGDGNDTELVADWATFPTITMTPNAAQSLRFQLTVDNLPFVSGGNANSLIVVSGVILPGLGFVPLGLDGQSDSGGSGIVGSFVTKMAPPHGGLEAGRYAVLATAVRFAGQALPGPGSTRIYSADSLPTAVNLATDGWLDSPLDATWSEPTRTVALPALGANLFRVVLASQSGAWHVYVPATGATSAIIPSAPAGGADRAAGASVSVDAVDLVSPTDPRGIFGLEAGGPLGLDAVTRGFSRAVIAP